MVLVSTEDMKLLERATSDGRPHLFERRQLQLPTPTLFGLELVDLDHPSNRDLRRDVTRALLDLVNSPR